VLFRLFPFDPTARATEEGGPLYVPRLYQGAGRHDNPARYGALYASRLAVSAVAERLQAFQDRNLTDLDLVSARGLRYSLAVIDDSALGPVVDLDDPHQLADRGWRPSRVATRDRSATQPLALSVFDEGADGLLWWSTLEASWTNVTLFAERAASKLRLADEPEPLSVASPVLRAATEALGIRLART
jgi:hypothetical protein